MNCKFVSAFVLASILSIIKCDTDYGMLTSWDFDMEDYHFKIETFRFVNPRIEISDVKNDYALFESPKQKSILPPFIKLDSTPFLQIGRGQIRKDSIFSGNIIHYPTFQNISKKISVNSAESIVVDTKPATRITGTIAYDSQNFTYEIIFFVNSNKKENFTYLDYELKVRLEGSLEVPSQSESDEYYYVALNFDSDREEEIFGFGLEYTVWNFKGHTWNLVSSEGGVGRGLEPYTYVSNRYMNGLGGSQYTTYAPSPNFITSFNRGFYFDTNNIGKVDFTKQTEGQMLFWDCFDLKGSLFGGEDGLELTQKQTNLTGRMQRLPEWIGEGAILGTEGGSENVQASVKNITDWGTPLVGVWMQDWAGGKNFTEGYRALWNWQVNYEYYPDWNDMVKGWLDKGIRTFVYTNPYFANLTGYNLRNDYYQELSDNGYFIKNSEGNDYIIDSVSIKFSIVDLTNPDAFKWWVDIIKNNVIKEAGAFGWMHDFGESTPLDAQAFISKTSNKSQIQLHNQYPEDWSKVAEEACEGNLDYIWFMRAGSGNSPRHTRAQWMGDQNYNLEEHDGLHSAMIGMLNSGISGYGLGHSDIGGYTLACLGQDLLCIQRTSFKVKRWIEMSAFSDSIFRSHPGQTVYKDLQIYQDEDLGRFYAKFATIFASLNSYRQRLMIEMEEKGWPQVRSLMLHYYKDKQARKIKDQFLLGRELLMAPIFEDNSYKRDVYLPEGSWMSIFNKQTYECGTQGCYLKSQTAELGKPLVYIMQGGQYFNKLINTLKSSVEIQ